MIIKGKREAVPPEEEPLPRVAPAGRESSSALTKGGGGSLLFRTTPATARYSALFKKGSQPDAAPEESPSATDDCATDGLAATDGLTAAEETARERLAASLEVVHIPTGDPPAPPPSAASTSSAPAASAMTAAAAAAVPAGPPPDQVVLEEAKKRAETMVREAQAEAKKIGEESRIYCENAQLKAEKEGFAAGNARGMAAARAELSGVINQVRNVLAESVAGREFLLRSAQAEIARLACKIAERVTATAAVANPEIIQNQVNAALDRVRDREHISVHVNAADLELVRSEKANFEKLLEGPKSFDIVADAKVDRGGCIIETNLGNVDARITTQLAALKVVFDEIERNQRAEWELAAEVARKEMLATLAAADPPDIPEVAAAEPDVSAVPAPPPAGNVEDAIPAGPAEGA